MKETPVVKGLTPLQKLAATAFILTLLMAFGRAKGAEENPLPKVAVEIGILNSGFVRYETDKYTFFVKNGQEEPETVQVFFNKPDELMYQIDAQVDLVLDKGSDFRRVITKREKNGWKSEWEKVKKMVRIQNIDSRVQFDNWPRMYEFVAETTETGPGGNLYILSYTVGKDTWKGTKTFKREEFKYSPPRDKKFLLGVELGLYVPILVGEDGKRFIPIE